MEVVYENLTRSLPNLVTASSSETGSSDGCVEYVKDSGTAQEFDNHEHPHCGTLLRVLRERFLLSELGPNQVAPMKAALLGYGSFIMMPIGGGKFFVLPGFSSLTG
ncbi:hypothetical protein QAD02_006827 [Eretmocerus hayati]|uniref:Uncharacterized protein n=1 Tax=Eretmocerus hayati TaxID=131215 RepID=A0ACC2N204_9HYME|nr:hypothetical protein QAD02_006827 [Eretmocerus hayati]